MLTVIAGSYMLTHAKYCEVDNGASPLFLIASQVYMLQANYVIRHFVKCLKILVVS